MGTGVSVDWIDEKIGQIRHRIQDLSVKWALAAYLLLAFFAAFVCSWLIQQLCISRCNEILYPYGVDVYRERIAGNIYYSGTEAAMYLLSDGERVEIRLLQLLSNAAPWILTGCGAVCAAVLFYRMRLRRPCEILKNGAAEMGRKNLDFEISYDSRDEMGELCRTFERMRREVVADREELWRRIEDQKEINAAFAHDMRTPLTVLRGYPDPVRGRKRHARGSERYGRRLVMAGWIAVPGSAGKSAFQCTALCEKQSGDHTGS